MNIKQFYIGILSVLFLFVLTACGTTIDQEDTQQNLPNQSASIPEKQSILKSNQTKEETANTSYVYGFNKFLLTADYGGTKKAIDIEFTIRGDQHEAFYKDNSKDIKLYSQGAINELQDILSTFHFTSETSDEDVLTEVLKSFQIPNEAENIVVNITYKDGIKKEYIEKR